MYITSFQSQKPLQVHTHFTDAETDSMPAQGFCSASKPHHQPPQGNVAQVNLVGLIGSKGLSGTLGENCPTRAPLPPSKKQTLSCYILTANCRGLSKSCGNKALQGLWLVRCIHPFIHPSLGSYHIQSRGDSWKYRAKKNQL